MIRWGKAYELARELIALQERSKELINRQSVIQEKIENLQQRVQAVETKLNYVEKNVTVEVMAEVKTELALLKESAFKQLSTDGRK